MSERNKKSNFISLILHIKGKNDSGLTIVGTYSKEICCYPQYCILLHGFLRVIAHEEQLSLVQEATNKKLSASLAFVTFFLWHYWSSKSLRTALQIGIWIWKKKWFNARGTNIGNPSCLCSLHELPRSRENVFCYARHLKLEHVNVNGCREASF